MSLGGFFSSLAGRLAREAATDAVTGLLATHANRRKPGDPPPTSVHNGAVVLTLYTLGSVALCAIFAWLVLNPSALENDGRTVWLVISTVFALGSLLALWGAAVHRIDWEGDRVRFRHAFGDRTMPWSDIVGIAEKSYPPRIRIAFCDGGAFAIYETMQNSRYFMRLIESQLNPEGDVGGKRKRRRRRGRH